MDGLASERKKIAETTEKRAKLVAEKKHLIFKEEDKVTIVEKLASAAKDGDISNETDIYNVLDANEKEKDLQ